jgi:hypothetical protein
MNQFVGMPEVDTLIWSDARTQMVDLASAEKQLRLVDNEQECNR